MDLANLSTEDFVPLINERFSIDADGYEPLTLAEVETKPRVRQGVRRPFALVFRGESDLVLPQRIYRLEHPTAGAFDLFLVPIAKGSDQVLYEAIFT